jgi:hypothetical protein
MKPVILFAGIFMVSTGCSFGLHAQTSHPDITSRVDSLERRVNRIEFSLKSKENAPRTQTRSNQEKGELSGIVISDNKGVSLKIGGFVQVDAIHDLQQNKSGNGFQASGIVIPNDQKSQTLYNIGASRFNLSGSVPIHNEELTTFIEFDMFNPAMVPVLRNAWAEYAGFGAGLYWSNFMDLDAYPNTLDYNGPNAMIFGRQVQFRYTWSVNDHIDWATALEDPRSYIDLPLGYSPLKQFPDLTSSVEYDWGDSHIRVAGVLHPLALENQEKEREHNLGYGISIGTLLQQTRNKDNFTLQFNYGKGIGKYINDISSGYRYDGVYDTTTHRLQTLPMLGLTVSYDHWWSDKMSSTIGAGYLHINNLETQNDTELNNTRYALANFIYYPNEFIKTGLEWMYGRRENKDHAHAYDNRLQFTVQLMF